MRIVSGKYRHRLIEFPKNATITRPTKDRVRESIFSAVGDITDKVVLDLYAGSGSMGIESLSRGAKFCYFVDIDKEAISCVFKNLKSLNEKNATCINSDDLNAINKFVNEMIKFDLVILDPPYAHDNYNDIIGLLVDNDLLNKQAIIVVENNKQILYNDFDLYKNKSYHYGDINVDILWRK